MKRLLPILAVALGCSMCTAERPQVTRGENHVDIAQAGQNICVEIIDEDIIHIKKTPIEKLEYMSPDLITQLKPQNVEWKLKESRRKTTITTDEVKVVVNADGTIEYYDDNGKHIVSEIAEGSLLDPASKTKAAVQTFTVGDEALYGLGQFQSGIIDWKHVPVTLHQYNQEAAVPFLVSTKGYGILWNNYSVTDFNPAENEIVFGENSEVVAKKLDYDATDINVENVVNSKAELDETSNIRQTLFTPTQSGLYTFYVDSDKGGRMKGHIKVTIDDDVIVNYTTIWVPMSFSGKKYLEKGKEYKIVFQNSGARIPGRLLYNAPDYNKTQFASHSGTAIDYFLLAGDNMAEAVELNHKLTGNTPMMNKKYYGFWQCRERYHTQEELLENATEMRKREIPFDVIVQDWLYWPADTKGPEWDRKKYPNPAAMTKKLSDLKLDLMVSVWPCIVNDPLLEKYDLGAKDKLGKTPYMNFWNKSIADRYYKILSDSMFHMGVKSIWLDGSEPEGMPNNDFQTGEGEFRYLANAYSLMVTKTMYEGKRAEYPRERVTNLTRSAFLGQQHYGAVTWSGDVQATWEQFSEQIAAGLNFTMAGIPYWSHDIGGFFRDKKSKSQRFEDQYASDEYKELLTRWFQFGAFSPVFRLHGYVSQTEVWRYGAAFEAVARKFIDLRYQLMPYIYSQAWKITNEGLVMMAPLAYYYPEDKATWDIKDQLFFGENIMAAFVTKYEQREKEVYLPKGEWFDFWTNEKIEGGKTITAAAELDQIPLYVKAGSIVPFGPKVQYATETTAEPTHIRIYPGDDAEFTLYLDDDSSYDYEQGIFSEVEFSYDDSSKSLEIELGDGQYIDFAKNPMTFVVDVMGSDKSYEVTFAGKELEISLK